MKYRLINPEVFATEVTNENRSVYTTPKMTPHLGVFAVTFADGHLEFIPKDDFLKQYKPTLLSDAKREMLRLCTQIIEQETMLDDQNAETLLANTVEIAKQLRRLIQ